MRAMQCSVGSNDEMITLYGPALPCFWILRICRSSDIRKPPKTTETNICASLLMSIGVDPIPQAGRIPIIAWLNHIG